MTKRNNIVLLKNKQSFWENVYCLHKTRNGKGIFITVALNHDHACFLIVRIHFNRRILTVL
jgi:hypothetical protein